MTLQQLKYIIEAANQGSINEAAKRLFITQPSLSNSIKELEAELNMTIFTRTNKGIQLSVEGAEFLGYARQVVQQAELLENRYLNAKPAPQHFAVSTQHYAFAVNAFVDLVKEHGMEQYEFTLRETKTYEIIDDVKNLRSEIGIIYRNEFNKKVFDKVLKENNLIFIKLFQAKPHVFISKNNPLAVKESVSLQDLDDYPYLYFEQGDNNSFYYSEEILSTQIRNKSIKVSDRATLFNLLIGLNGYTISTGIINAELNGSHIIAVPLDVNETITVGYIKHKNVSHSHLGECYIKALQDALSN